KRLSDTELPAGGAGEVVEAFRGLRPPRLVVLGPPGSGKTGLLVLLTIRLLGERRPGPVPVLLSMSSWDARRQGFLAWAGRRLRDDSPRVRAAAGDLLRHHRVLPVLDGLDELPAHLRTRAVEELTRLGPDQPLVIACRTEEYRAVVAMGGLLRAAAAVEPANLTPAAVSAYLRGARSFLRAPERWRPVLAALEGAGGGPL